jgi:hypothetical protein
MTHKRAFGSVDFLALRVRFDNRTQLKFAQDDNLSGTGLSELGAADAQKAENELLTPAKLCIAAIHDGMLKATSKRVLKHFAP